MGDKSPIEWTNATWNPIGAFDRETGKRGWFCTKVSEGCTNCYAEKLNLRLGNGHLYRVGNLPKIEWRVVNLDQPIQWKRARMIFVNSMTDLFHEDIPDDMVAQVFAAMELAPQHTFQVLTKRAARMRDLMTSMVFRCMVDTHREKLKPGCGDFEWPLPNVWLGVSTEHQKAADERIPELLQTPAAIRFLSCEPLLGPLDLSQYLAPAMRVSPPRDENGHVIGELTADGIVALNQIGRAAMRMYGGEYVDWVIVGGESGAGARPMDERWARRIVRECQDTGVPVFVKQMGAWTAGNHADFIVTKWLMDGYVFVPPVIGAGARQRPENAIAFSVGGKGGDMAFWPKDLRVRQMPKATRV